MKLLRRKLLAIAATIAAAPLAAQEPAPAPLPDLTAMSSKELFALFEQDENRWQNEPCTFGVPVITALESSLPPPMPPEFRRLRLLAEMFCAEKEKRYEDGLKFTADFNEISPESPLTGLAVYFASQLEDVDRLLAVLRGLNDAGLGALDRDSYWSAFRTLRAAGRTGDLDTLALEWAGTGKFALLDAELHEGVAVAALRAAAKTGRGDIADTLLASITSPSSYIELLTFREYEPFWPQIEARAGKNLALVGEENVRLARARLANNPEDRDRFSEAAHALHYNGQFKEAIALAKRWRQRAAAGADMEEGDAWALNIEAYAYDSLGQPEKADAVFDDLAKVDPDANNWVVNFVINRASRLVGQGRWEDGLTATELARAVAEKQGSTYAKLIIASDRACAFERLARSSEAAPELAYLRENWKEGISLAVRGLTCHGLRDEAAGLLVAGIKDETQRDQALGAFQTDELDLFYTATILPQAGDLLPDYRELAAELAKYTRPMPEAFIPQAALKRAARKEGASR